MTSSTEKPKRFPAERPDRKQQPDQPLRLHAARQPGGLAEQLDQGRKERRMV